MSFSAGDLLQVPDGLRRVARDLQRDVAVLVIESPARALLIEKLKTQLAVFRQARFGRSSETIDRDVAALRQLLNERICRHAGAGRAVDAGDPPVRLLDPGRGGTKTRRLWTAMYDERPFGSTASASDASAAAIAKASGRTDDAGG
ncbi:hypothetical protein [Methylocella silvestris]|nr:hypothetical protein [Methylocella silvestris]